jgi:hypothetical protein
MIGIQFEHRFEGSVGHAALISLDGDQADQKMCGCHIGMLGKYLLAGIGGYIQLPPVQRFESCLKALSSLLIRRAHDVLRRTVSW